MELKKSFMAKFEMSFILNVIEHTQIFVESELTFLKKIVYIFGGDGTL